MIFLIIKNVNFYLTPSCLREILPNFYFGYHECDVFRVNQSDFVFEYEIKVSRADFFADFKKNGGVKHSNLKYAGGIYCPNRFFFVVPKGLIKSLEIPDYAGLIYFNNGNFEIIKSGKLIHKRKFTDFRSLAHTLAGRDEGHRQRIKFLRNTDYEKEIAAAKREQESYRKLSKQLNQELFMLRTEQRKLKTDIQ